MVSVMFTAGHLAVALFPGFSTNEQEIAIRLLRVLATLVPLNNLIAYLNALYQADRRFGAPAWAGVAGTAVTLAYVVAFHRRQGIDAVAWGVVCGAAATVVLLSPLLVSVLARSITKQLLPRAQTRAAIRLLMPLLAGALLWRLDPLVDRWLGSYLAEGSISHMGYAWRLASGLMLIGTSGLSIVACPAIAAHAAAGRRDALDQELAHSLRLYVILIAPVCLGVAGFRVPVVRLLFERGRFFPADTLAVASLLLLYVGVIFGAGLGDLLSRTFYAQRDMVTPVIISAVGFLIAVFLKFVLVRQWGAAGLVAATSLFYIFSAAVLLVVLVRRLGPGLLTGLAPALVRASVCSLLACWAASWIVHPSHAWSVFPAAAIGAVAYVCSLWLCGDEFARRAVGRLSELTSR
jgi:putative peptidoglycan lipid II flippase